MAVSYLSKPIESNPYVLPVDLNLLAKVNSYKQQKFYANADAIKGQLNQLYTADIANGAQKELLTNKVTNLSEQLNAMGGIDYSDMNVTNTIQGYSSDIYNDKNVINGIVSTKKIREFEKNVEKMATDPKLSKYYNVSNIARVRTQMINPYTNGGIDATYAGPSAPRPYEGNPFEKMLKMMKNNLPPNVEIRSDGNGNSALYRINSTERLSDEDISAAFDGLMDANTKAQIADDAWYNFDYATGGKFDKDMGQKIYSDDILNRKKQYELRVQAIDVDLSTSISEDEKAVLRADKEDLQKRQIPKLDKELTTRNNEFAQMYDKDRDGAIYSLYAGRMRQDVIKAAGYSRDKVTYIKNQEWAFEKAKEMEYLKHGLKLNSDGSVTPIPGMGKKLNAKGEVVPEEAITPFNTLGTTNMNGKEMGALAVTEASIKENNDALRSANTTDALTIFTDLIKLNGWEKEMGFQQNVNGTGVGPAQTLSSDLMRNIVGTDGYFSQADLVNIQNQGLNAYTKGLVDKNGNDVKTGKPYQYNVEKDGLQFGMTFQQMKVVTKMQDAWSAAGRGEIDKLPSGFRQPGFVEKFSQFAEKHQQRELTIKAQESFVKRVYDQALANKDLTSEERKIYQDYRENGDVVIDDSGKSQGIIRKKYTIITPSPGGSGAGIQKTALGEKLDKIKKKVDTSISDVFKTASEALNYWEYNLSDNPKTLPDGLISRITTTRLNNQMETVPEKIQPLGISRNDMGDGYKLRYNYANKGEDKPYFLDITNAEAMLFGDNVRPPSNPELELYFKYGEQQSPEMTVRNPKFNMPVVYKIKKMSDGYKPYILYGGKEYPIDTRKNSESASTAQENVKTLVNQPFNSYGEFIGALVQQNNNINQ